MDRLTIKMESPEFYETTPYCAQLIGEEKRQYSSNDTKTGDHFFVEEFLDFSNADAGDGPGFDPAAAAGIGSSDSSTALDNSAFLPDIASDSQFSGELCVPYDDLAELEWLSNIVEESFSSEDLQRLQLISGVKASGAESAAAAVVDDNSHRPAKARSKRSRAPPCNWSSRLLLLSSSSSSVASSTSTSDDNDNDSAAAAAPLPPAAAKKAPRKKEAAAAGDQGEGRRCLHCATDKTPQWRTGPMGPKTLCNACGVRYKSGRLVPEYRPATSPTFVLTKHSNSHRKVLELRRQKDFARAQHHHGGGVVFDHRHGPLLLPPPSNAAEDFLIHHPVGPDFRQMI